jgi:hypothetical protein
MKPSHRLQNVSCTVKIGLAAWVLAACGVCAQQAVPDFVEVTHSATGRTIALVNPAASRNHGQPLAGLAPVNRPPNAVVLSHRTPRVLDATLHAAAQRFGIASPEKELVFKMAQTDALLMVHEHWRQEVNSVPVLGAGLIVHRNASGEITGINGRLLSQPVANTTPRIPAGDATAIARRLAGAGAKPVEPPGGPRLSILNEGFLKGRAETASRLVWEIEVSATDHRWGGIWFIDARDGSVVWHDSGVRDITRRSIACGDEFGDVTCYSNRTSILFPGYVWGRIEPSLNPVGGTGPRGSNPYHNTFGTPVDVFGSTGVDDNYTFAGQVHGYYLDKFARDGANARGGSGSGTASDPYTLTLTFADINGTTNGTICLPGGGYAFIGSPNNALLFCAFTPTLDLFGHEYTHVLSHYKNVFPDNSFHSLGGVGEAGALNEAQSDLFGEFIESYVTGSVDWVTWPGSNVAEKRNLANPPGANNGTYIYPDRFHHPDYYCGASDNGGIHANASVMNKAGYLATVGGSFNGCSISGLGIPKTEQIWYRALTTYYADNETFNGAYVALRQACLDLYPAADCAELTKALQAVELDQPGKCSGLPAQPATCAPPPVLHLEQTPLGPRWYWGSDSTGWTLQVSYDLTNPTGWTDVQVITGPGEYLPQASAPAMFCRLNYKR